MGGFYFAPKLKTTQHPEVSAKGSAAVTFVKFGRASKA